MPLGWHVSVYRQQAGGAAPAAFGAGHGARLAVWQTGLGGLGWLDELVAGGEAVALGGDGYPLEYTAPARCIVPQLQAGPPLARAVWRFDPGDVLSPDWAGRTTTDPAAMDACRPDEWLIIQAWDES